jgi:hypothetical protein
MEEYFKLASAILTAIGSAGVLILALSSFLGKIWANRILEADRARYAREVEDFKRQASLRLKEYEIKTSTIQAELNQVVLKLAPALGSLYNACYLFVELGGIHLKYVKDDPSLLRTLGTKFETAAGEVHQQLMAAKLYLDADAFEKARRFEKKMYELKSSASTVYGIDSFTFEPNGPDPGDPTQATAKLLEEVKAAEPLLDELIDGFRRKMGTAT